MKISMNMPDVLPFPCTIDGRRIFSMIVVGSRGRQLFILHPFAVHTNVR